MKSVRLALVTAGVSAVARQAAAHHSFAIRAQSARFAARESRLI
jgi:hypothetical protein